MPAASALARAIKAFAAVARRRRLRWYIFGGQAVAVHGRPRMTLDIDITIELGDIALEDLLAELGRAGFEPRVRWSPAEVELLRVVPVVHRASRVPVDLVLAGEGLEAEFLTRARPVDPGRDGRLSRVAAVAVVEGHGDRGHVTAVGRQIGQGAFERARESWSVGHGRLAIRSLAEKKKGDG